MARRNNDNVNVDSQEDEDMITPPEMSSDELSEAASEDEATSETPVEEVKEPALTQEQKDEIFNSLPEAMQEAVIAARNNVNEHNTNTRFLKNQGSNDYSALLSEIRENNPSNNEAIASINKQITQYNEQIEKLIQDANAIIKADGLMPKVPSPEELQVIKESYPSSLKTCRDQLVSFENLEKLAPPFKGKLLVLMPDIETLRNTSSSSSSGSSDGTETKRPRFSEILVNGVTSDDKGNKVYVIKDGKESFTFTETAKYLKKQASGMRVTAKTLSDLYFAKFDGDQPDSVTFEVPHTFKTASGSEETINFTITAKRA